VTVALIDPQGNILFSNGPLPTGRNVLSWSGVSQALAGENGAIFEPETGEGDDIAYASVPSTVGC
jgi:hypothetical protein